MISVHTAPIMRYVRNYGERSEKVMKLLNYDSKALIIQNIRSAVKEEPVSYTIAQYKILCRLIVQKCITKDFFDFLLLELYGLSDWKQLSYPQMYELIHILTYWNYRKGTICHE